MPICRPHFLAFIQVALAQKMANIHTQDKKHVADSVEPLQRHFTVCWRWNLTILPQVLVTVAHHFENEGILIVIKAMDTFYDLPQLAVELNCLVLILSALLVPAGGQDQACLMLHANPTFREPDIV